MLKGGIQRAAEEIVPPWPSESMVMLRQNNSRDINFYKYLAMQRFSTTISYSSSCCNNNNSSSSSSNIIIIIIITVVVPVVAAATTAAAETSSLLTRINY